VVTSEALAPFRVAQPARPDGDPQPLPYLWDEADQSAGAYDIELEAFLSTEGLRAKRLPPHRMSASNAQDLFWTLAQLVAHHTCCGCNLQPGDLFGTGTISGPTLEGYGSLMELSADGTRRKTLASGETRTFVENGDEVIFRAHCRRPGFVSIGFGECRAQII
jgi:fumarylacetoacetase